MSSCGCPLIETDTWDGTQHRWAHQSFLRTSLRCVFGTPFGIAAAHAWLQKTLDTLKVHPAQPQMVLYRLHRFSGEMLLALEAAPAQPHDALITYTEQYLMSEVHKGGPESTGLAVKRLQQRAVQENKQLEDILLWPVTCGTCAASRGGAQTVLLGLVATPERREL